MQATFPASPLVWQVTFFCSDSFRCGTFINNNIIIIRGGGITSTTTTAAAGSEGVNVCDRARGGRRRGHINRLNLLFAGKTKVVVDLSCDASFTMSIYA